jgi:hypothetical protein
MASHRMLGEVHHGHETSAPVGLVIPADGAGTTLDLSRPPALDSAERSGRKRSILPATFIHATRHDGATTGIGWGRRLEPAGGEGRATRRVAAGRHGPILHHPLFVRPGATRRGRMGRVGTASDMRRALARCAPDDGPPWHECNRERPLFARPGATRRAARALNRDDHRSLIDVLGRRTLARCARSARPRRGRPPLSRALSHPLETPVSA